MIYLPQKDYELPDIDLLTLLFESDLAQSKERTILSAEAADPLNAITKAQARLLTKQLAYILRHHFNIGINGPNSDVVVCVSEGQVLLPTAYYGVVAAGGVFSSASTRATPRELAGQIRAGNGKLIITCPESQKTALEAARLAGVPLNRVLLLDSMSHKRIFQSLATGLNYLEHLEPGDLLDWQRITDPQQLSDSLVCLLYSSGTTGPPKGVRISHLNHVSEALIPQLMHRDWQRRRKREDPTFKWEHRTLAHLPTAHIAGCQGYFINPAVNGGTVYWMDKFDFGKFLEYNKTLQITTFFSVPSIYLLIGKSPLVTDQFQTLVHAISGAAPMGASLQQSAQKKLGCTISQTWGLSETTGSVTYMPWGLSDTTGSVSPLLPNVRLRIVDDDDNDVEQGVEGELLMKGPVVTKGYYNAPDANKGAFTADGWFRTGDIGFVKDGLVYISDRKKELIKYKGLQVAPAELENLLIEHPLIQDAAVIGVPDTDASGDELPRAYVVADQTKISSDAIKKYIKEQVAPHKQLRGGVAFIDAIPKGPSGKILRRELRERLKIERRQAKL